MNFDFSQHQDLLRDQARRFLAANSPPRRVRRVLQGEATHDADLWRGMAELGWMGTAVPQQFGGVGLTPVDLCVIAEELGRVLAPVPFSSSVYLAIEAILLAGSEAQKRDLVPGLAAGRRIGTLAWSEGTRPPTARNLACRFSNGALSGEKMPVPDGGIAGIAIVAARRDDGEIGLFVVELAADGVARQAVETLDPSRGAVRLTFDNAKAEPLEVGGDGWNVLQRVLDRGAILMAFEQLGGADAALEMATAYARERHAFGRPIGSFQAIKHKLADVYVAGQVARSNAYFGAWALTNDAPDLPVAAAAARVAATEAYSEAAKENIQTHGGIGFTWEHDCHLHYRRAKHLALALGSERRWKSRLISGLQHRNTTPGRA